MATRWCERQRSATKQGSARVPTASSEHGSAMLATVDSARSHGNSDAAEGAAATASHATCLDGGRQEGHRQVQERDLGAVLHGMGRRFSRQIHPSVLAAT